MCGRVGVWVCVRIGIWHGLVSILMCVCGCVLVYVYTKVQLVLLKVFSGLLL